jgi:hypothetical protein
VGRNLTHIQKEKLVVLVALGYWASAPREKIASLKNVLVAIKVLIKESNVILDGN